MTVNFLILLVCALVGVSIGGGIEWAKDKANFKIQSAWPKYAVIFVAVGALAYFINNPMGQRFIVFLLVLAGVLAWAKINKPKE